MSEKIDKGLSVFTRRSKTPVVEESAPVVIPDVIPETRPVNHLEKSILAAPTISPEGVKEGKFSFKVDQHLLDGLEDQVMAIKRNTGWKITKKEFLSAFLEAYLSNNPKVPETKNYPELVSYLKKVLKE